MADSSADDPGARGTDDLDVADVDDDGASVASDWDPGDAECCPYCNATADWAIAHGHHPACPNHMRRRRERTHTAEEICNLPPLDWLVDGLLTMPGESVLYSPPKLAKTFFALDLALSVASGQHFMGREVRRGHVVYVVAEGVGGMGARVQSWHDYDGRAGAYVEGVTFITEAINLMDDDAVTKFREHLYDLTPNLTVIDTLHRCALGADENAARDMGRVVASLDAIRNETGGHVLAVHHAGKDTTKGMRGSSALLGAVDTVIELSGDRDAIRCEVTDQKDAEPPPPWWCQLERVGSSAVIVTVADRDVMSDTDRKVLRTLESLAPEDRTATKWQEVADEAEGVKSTAFYQSRGRLKGQGRVAGGGRRGALYTLPSRDEEAK
jgi:RecA-family ATPase